MALDFLRCLLRFPLESFLVVKARWEFDISCFCCIPTICTATMEQEEGKLNLLGVGAGMWGVSLSVLEKVWSWLGFFLVPNESIFFAAFFLHVWDTYLSDLHTSFSQCLVNTITIHYAKGLRVRLHSHLATAHIHAPYWDPIAARPSTNGESWIRFVTDASLDLLESYVSLECP